uniref:Uncharacterized protein n=1 Tax=viral metagenome TaxID=1070528 RepID=A0A6C0I8C6_9ZZZZ
MFSIKPLVIVNSSGNKNLKKKVVDKRKADLKGIVRTLQDLSKKETERCKELYEDHLLFINDPEPEVEIVPVPVNDDSFFEK